MNHSFCIVIRMVVQVKIKIQSNEPTLCYYCASASQNILRMFWDVVCLVSVLITYYQGFEPAETLEKGFEGRMSQIPAK